MALEYDGIPRLTYELVHKLTNIWQRIFDQEMCEENLRKLEKHVEQYYEELVEESLAKEAFIKKEIDDLHREAATLRRLLKTEVVLPCDTSGDKPLIVLQSEMDKSLAELRECLRQRREQICELLLEQDSLCEELGETPRPLLADPLPTAEEIEEFRQHLEQLKTERAERMNRLSSMRREIKGFLQLLELEVSTEAEDRLLNYRQIKLNKDTFTELQRMHQRYGAEVQDIRERIDSMRKKLDSLWVRLDTSPNTRNKFMRYTEYTQRTYDVFYGELQRCETLKSQNIKRFVQQIREEIVEWWKKTLKSDVECSRFQHFNSDCYTDDLLVLHEMELEDLKLYYESNRQIFELYADRKILWDRMTALEAKASEPGRYNNRGGQLLKEEKERKMIATKLPKIEQQITELVQDYEAREHLEFLVFGKNILDVMADEWEKKRQDKEKLSSARKNAQTPLSRSHLLTVTRTPMSARNTSTASMRKAPSTNNMLNMPNGSSQKRKLNPLEKHTPLAKRSLLHALNSPHVFEVPTTSKVASGLKQTPFKSPLKKKRVLATTLRRKSGRLSGSHKKRRSMNRSGSGKTPAAPRIVIDEISDGYTDASDDAYESFQKCIEPDSRSSIIQTNGKMAMRATRLQKPKLNLPTPRIIRTPSKQNLRELSTIYHRTPPAHSPASTRKLTTKNLPIII